MRDVQGLPYCFALILSRCLICVTGELYSGACNPSDPRLVATGGCDDKGFLWRIGQGDWAQDLQGHKVYISCFTFSANGQLLLRYKVEDILFSYGEMKFKVEAKLVGCAVDQVASKRTLSLGGFRG
ncbi:hypothetical protein Scep_001738 [Stephania cephalantha]|uniref:Uncharacterized protein n=1 Tax=Stephania cephalantha TaxID=152367 RepID=A0AAP0LA02_9MAGN